MNGILGIVLTILSLVRKLDSPIMKLWNSSPFKLEASLIKDFPLSLLFFKKLINKGIEIDYINLDIGLGTFKPISTDYVEDFNIHSENYEIDKNTFENIIKKKEIGYKIYCVGTTTLRTLEYAFTNSKLKS